MIVTRKQALEILGDGHSFWSVECAREVCGNVGVPWSDALVKRQYSHIDRHSPKHSVHVEVEGEAMVNCYRLTQYVMNALDVQPRRWFNGRGSQAQHNAEVIAAELNRREGI